MTIEVLGGDIHLIDLQTRLPMGMQEAGWIVLPSGGTFSSHRLDYAYVEKSNEEYNQVRHLP